jgi:lysyl-tRNA synthetase class 1
MARGGQSSQQQGDPTDWVTRAADDAIRHAGEGAGPITTASGASPSGPIHLGNLREFLTVHFVAEEIRRRGLAVRHLHSWDDYDRFRKVPVGVDPSWSEHIGRPLSAVPDPWACHESWAEHFKEPLRAALAEMGVEMEEVSQTERYRAGAYRDQILTAVARRDDIERVMARYRTKAAPVPESVEEAAALEDSVAHEDDTIDGAIDGGAGAQWARFPYKPYCRGCGRDTTAVTAYDDESTDLAYACQVCGFSGVTNLATQNEGKLVWKVDWPMRWSVEGVDFEPGGVDHATPGSSYTVGRELVKEIYGGRAPSFVGYSFVGVAGMAKMSSSKGGVPTAADALKILEAPVLRWLYVRRQPRQAFTIDFGPEVVRLYDEWDALGRKAANPDRRDAQVLAFERLGKAMTWTAEFVPPEDRTTVRTSADTARLAALNEDEELWLAQLLDRLPDELDLEPVTALVYGVPKLARGMGIDDAPTEQVKQDQKEFFRLLYHLLVDADRGPRLPTLFVALGAEKVRSLLTAPR